MAPQPQEVAVALEAQRGDHRGQGLVPRIDPVAAQEEMDVRQRPLRAAAARRKFAWSLNGLYRARAR